MQANKSLYVLFFTVITVYCFSGVFSHSFWSANDTREAAMIWEMNHSHTYTVPVINNSYYYEKPPLYHWISLAIYKLTGSMSEGILRLTSALSAYFTLIILFLLSCKAKMPRAGLLAIILCSSSGIFLEYSRVVQTDMLLCFMTILSLYSFWIWYESKYIEKFTSATRQSLYLVIFLFLTSFSFYTKGLIGPGMITFSCLSFLIINKKFLAAFSIATGIGFLSIALISPWAFALYKLDGLNAITEVFWANQFGRFFQFNNPELKVDPYFVHKEPMYYYIKTLPVRLLPWTLLAIPSFSIFIKDLRIKTDGILKFIAISFLCILIVLHASSAKAARYAIPVLPFLFFYTARWIEKVFNDSYIYPSNFSSKLSNIIIYGTYAIVSVAFLIVPVFFLIYINLIKYCVYFKDLVLKLSFSKYLDFDSLQDLSIIASALILLWVIISFLYIKSKNQDKENFRFFFPIFFNIYFIIASLTVVKYIDYHKTYKHFGSLVKKEIAAGRKVAMKLSATDDERIIAAMLYYVGTQMELTKETDDFLSSKTEKRGIIFKAEEIKQDNSLSSKYKEKAPLEEGRKTKSLKLLIND